MQGLKGKIFITTCAEDKANKFKILLEPKGVQVINFPLISIQAIHGNDTFISQVLSEINSYDWIIFSSTNGVKYFFYWIDKFQIQFESTNLKFAVIGKATNQELEKQGYKADFIGESNNSIDFAQHLDKIIDGNSQKVLFPTGNISMQNIENVIGQKNNIKKLIVYQTNMAETINHQLSDIIIKKQYDLVLFLSPSAVRSFMNSVSDISIINTLKSIPIGKSTEKALLQVGNIPVFTPKIPNIENMVNEIENYYNTNKI